MKNISVVGAVIFVSLALSGGAIGSLWKIHSMREQKDANTGDGLVETPTTSHTPSVEIQDTKLYFAVEEGCGPHYEGACVLARTGPGRSYPVALRLRTGTVLYVSSVTETPDGIWYKVGFDEAVRYPSRLSFPLYVSADVVRAFEHQGTEVLSTEASVLTQKRILIDRSDQTLIAYEGETLFMKAYVSTGLELTPTPRGTFRVYKKMPSRYMQGPLPGISDDSYDLPGVPWNLYFTEQGGAIHGTYWHSSFGAPYSHGCVNLSPTDAARLYTWADIGTTVIVRD